MNNAILRKANVAKKDEFYTQLSDVEKELKHYQKHFKGKTVLCNCDDPRISNFFHYFSYNFEKLKLKKLITTCYKSQQRDLFSQNDSEKAIYLEYEGDKNNNKVPDPNDPRNKLFLQLLKFVETFKPKMFVMENVPGILTMDEGKVIKRIEKSFSKIGYTIQYKILHASDFGVPQERKRIFIVGTKKKIPSDKLFPASKITKVTVEDALSDLADLGVNDRSSVYKNKPKSKFQSKMRKKSKIIYNHESCNHNVKIQKRFAKIPVGKNGRDVLKNSGTKKRSYYRMHPKAASNTITTIPEDFIHYKQNRIPTVREMARLQSFPDDFEFLGPKMTGSKYRKTSCPQYTQVANAIPPMLSEALFSNLKRVLKKYY